MSQPRERDLDRLLDLLADEAVGSLTAAERAELDGLLARFPEVDGRGMERAAAAAAVALAGPGATPLPEGLRRRLLADADAAGAAAPIPFPRRGAGGGRLAWLAAAACLAMFSGTLFWGLTTAARLRAQAEATLAAERESRARAEAAEARALAAETRAAETDARLAAARTELDSARQRIALLTPPDPGVARALRQQLLEEAPDAVTVAWQPWDNPAMVGVGGDVVWSDSLQQGFLRFTGLPKNDPDRAQYQLWIVDGTRGMEQRISGGVFNISGEGEVIIPIDPGLAVKTAAAFAVTVEQPTGTWVSDMTRKAVIAAVQR